MHSPRLGIIDTVRLWTYPCSRASVGSFNFAGGIRVFRAAQPHEPFHNSAADIDTGRAAFRIYCAPCHGIGAAGGSGPDLTLGVYEVGDSDEDLFEVIRDGVNGTEMSGFGERMNDNTIWRILAYVRSVARRDAPVLTGDASRGESIYQGRGVASVAIALQAQADGLDRT